MSGHGDFTPWLIEGLAGLRDTGPGSHHYTAAAAAWEPTATPGFWIKPLFTDTAKGMRTLLMKVDPGAWSAPHQHEGELEQLYLLQGAFQDQDGTLNIGDYCCRSPGAVHSGGSEGGALMLVIYTRG
ncbi:MAG: cupin domain-containing protein [Pseudomonas sp.]|uniref:cupin domain-containing protein n=1 Tax=Pseudomonas abieticivorans TaxID=2931382 RepID=UPI0020C16281|nr:cupin domain-containing protein [Pseudomonas sp. PIA16]MDE1169412.1 cupin domain-containing protein [Pseudomonas sp.]